MYFFESRNFFNLFAFIQDENTILHLACQYGHVSTVEKFLSLGVDPLSIHNHVCLKLQLIKCSIIFLSRITTLHFIWHVNMDIPQQLKNSQHLELTLQLKMRFYFIFTYSKFNQFLFEQSGNTPLHLACQYGHSLIVEKLLAFGVQCSIQNPVKFGNLLSNI